MLYVTHCPLSVEDPNNLAFNESGVVNVVVGNVPAAAAVLVGSVDTPGMTKICPGNAEPSTSVPLAFSIALQMVIEPVVGGVTVFACTVTEALALLFARFGSVVEAFSPTIALFVIVWPAVPAFTVAVIWRLAVELALKLPIVHVPVELAYVPTEATALSNVSPEGKVSVATTPVEAAGPRAETVNV